MSARGAQFPVLIFIFTAVSLLFGLPALGQTASSGGVDGAVLREARELRGQHHGEQAEALLRPLVSREPQNVAALILLAEVLVDEGGGTGGAEQAKRDQAAMFFERAIAADPNSREANDALGELMLREHHDPEAMDRFETVLAVTARDAEARRGELAAATELAIAARGAGHPEASIEVLRHARTRLPDDAKLLLELGLEAIELHMLPEAANALDAAWKLNAGDADIRYARARLEIEEQHMGEAESDLRAYLAVRPADASAHYGLGHVLAMEQRADDARAEFERSVELQPLQTESYYQLGQLDLDAHEDAKAEPLFQKALTRSPTHAGALTGMGVLAFRAKDYARAEEYLVAAEKSAPEYGPAHYYRGLALARLGRKDESASELNAAAELGSSAVHAVQAPGDEPGAEAPHMR
jgi:tetratricopeptide (TPR) repeat protein